MRFSILYNSVLIILLNVVKHFAVFCIEAEVESLRFDMTMYACAYFKRTHVARRLDMYLPLLYIV